MRDRPHEEAMIEYLRKDPGYAVTLLNSILEDGNQAELLIALRRISIALGEESGQHQGAEDVIAAIRDMGFRLSVESVQPPRREMAHA